MGDCPQVCWGLKRTLCPLALVLLAAQFVLIIARYWPRQAVLWLRKLGDKFGLKTDRDGLYLLLCGLSAVWQAVLLYPGSSSSYSPITFRRWLRCGQYRFPLHSG